MFGRSRKRHNIASTIVASDSRIDGDLHFVGGCHVDGVVHGSVAADPDTDASLSLAAGGTIDGAVAVPYVLLEGTVKGDVFASRRIVLGPTARVVGNVYYNLIEMAIGAEINGKLVHKPEGQVPLLEQTAKMEPSAAVPREA